MNDILGGVRQKMVVHQNELMFAGGTIMGVITVGSAIFATVKAMKEYKTAHDKLISVKENEESTKKDVAVGYVKFFVSVGKYYIIPVGTGVASFVLHLGAFNHLRAQNASLSATLTSTISTLEGYRERVARKYGEEEEYNLFNDIHTEEHEVITTDEETGKPLYITETENVAGDDTLIFTSGATGNTATDLVFIKNIENRFNTLLESRKYGIVTKNEVIEALGGKPKGGKSFCLGAVYNKAIIHKIIIQTKVIQQNLGMDDAYKPIYKEVIACEIKGLDDDISQLI